MYKAWAGLLLLLVSNSISAHGLAIEARHQSQKLLIRVCFDDGTPVWSARVRIPLTPELTGTTDADGHVSFPMPNVLQLTIIADAGDGHVARTTINLPPGPWRDNQLFTTAISESTSAQQRISYIGLGLLIIAIVTLVAMKVMSRRQPS